MIRDRFNVPVIDELCAWLNNMPSLLDEIVETTSCLLRQELFECREQTGG